ncbi:penicillin-insensitive murein endopeptidase [Vibrio sp.]|uniref:penicillin-insensitive murein endopeptidase n=1 Tax=Vibrio sp. TaxID=678 RepID=UPI003D0CEE78
MKGVWLSGLMVSLICPLSWATPWEQIRVPSATPAAAIGSYANGCLAGAVALPLKGSGYQVLRAERGRFYAHPETVQFVQELASQVAQKLETQLLVGDLSLPQGGRFSTGHASHQTGLDADIWLRFADQPLSPLQLAKPTPLSLVDLANYRLKREQWQPRHFQLLKMAASDNRVARIFVHPVIKQQLCASASNDNRSWLRKIRPWWGHHSHMHVRLNCPPGSQACKPQLPPPPGDGCGAELASWQPKPESSPPVAKTVNQAKAKPRKVIPQRCQLLLDMNG